MNPNSTIRPWLLACAAQFGIRHAYDFRWADTDARQHEAYFTYRLARTVPEQDGLMRDDSYTEGSNDMVRKGIKQHNTTVEIRLFNAQDGLYILGAMGVGAQLSEPIQRIFKSKQCAFHEILSIEDESFVDDEEIIYQHVMLVSFYERIELSLTEVNEIVDDILINLETGGYQWTINTDGYE